VGKEKKPKKHDRKSHHRYDDDRGSDYEHEWKSELKNIQTQLDQQFQLQKQLHTQLLAQVQTQLQIHEKKGKQATHMQDNVAKLSNSEEKKMAIPVNASVYREKNTSSKKTYANVWSVINQTVAPGNAIIFEKIGPLIGGITRLNHNTLKVNESGDYFINFIISFIVDDPACETNGVALFINNVEIPLSQSRFAVRTKGVNDIDSILQVSGTGIYTIPSGATLQIKNAGPNEIDVFSASGANSAAFTLVRL
jgi:hypothetical protein